MIVLQTNYGDITIALNHEKAPVTAANFEQYVRDGFYDGTLFHRVIDGFMIQGGGFDQEFNQKPTRDPIENEADNGLQNTIGTLAMARTQDPHSATAQFFINVGNNSFLNHSGKSLQGWGYAVFGFIIIGIAVATWYLVRDTPADVAKENNKRWSPPALDAATAAAAAAGVAAAVGAGAGRDWKWLSRAKLALVQAASAEAAGTPRIEAGARARPNVAWLLRGSFFQPKSNKLVPSSAELVPN